MKKAQDGTWTVYRYWSLDTSPSKRFKSFYISYKKKKIQTCLQYILQNVLNMKKVFGQGIKKTSSSAGILNRLLFGRPGPGI